MKRLIALLVVLGFCLGVVSMSEAATAAKKAPAKAAAKKVVKKAAAKKVVKKVVKKAVKAAPKVAPVAPAPPPPPVAPVPPPAPVAVKAAPMGSLFGWGVNTMLTGSYISTGKGSISGSGVIRGDWVMDDMMGLGPMVGLSANSVKFTLGTGYAAGSGLKAVPLFAGGIIMLPAEMMGGMSSYVSGGLNYVLYGNGKTSGRIGGEANVGLMFDLGMGLGKTAVQLGWSAIRSNTVTSKGVQLSVCQPINL